jgi:hypothetical protein
MYSGPVPRPIRPRAAAAASADAGTSPIADPVIR